MAARCCSPRDRRPARRRGSCSPTVATPIVYTGKYFCRDEVGGPLPRASRNAPAGERGRKEHVRQDVEFGQEVEVLEDDAERPAAPGVAGRGG